MHLIPVYVLIQKIIIFKLIYNSGPFTFDTCNFFNFIFKKFKFGIILIFVYVYYFHSIFLID